jgi:hypothetical protein
VKKYLLRLSNAKASIVGDIEDPENSRPTLKKRPQEDPNAPSTDPAEEKKDGPPQLKKRTETTPTPTPSPN